MQETQKMQVQSLGREDPLEKEMATDSSILENSHGQRSLVGYRWQRTVAQAQLSDYVHAYTR